MGDPFLLYYLSCNKIKIYLPIYLNLENHLLWRWSEIIGSAFNNE